MPQKVCTLNRQHLLCQYPRTYSIINIMIDICYFVWQTDNLSFQSRRFACTPMIQNAIPYFPCQIQSRAIFLQMLHHPNTLLIVTEWLGCILRECPFSNMTKRRMSKIMSQSNRLNQILIQKQRSGNRPSNLRNFQRMCQSGSVMISARRQKNLRLMFHPTEWFGMQNPIPVSLKFCTQIAFFFLPYSSFCPIRKAGTCTIDLMFSFF